MTDDEIKAARALCEAVFPVRLENTGYMPQPWQDFIRGAANLLPQAIDEIERLRAENERLRAIDVSNVGDAIDLMDRNCSLREERDSLREQLATVEREVAWRTEAMQSGHDYLKQLHDQLLTAERERDELRGAVMQWEELCERAQRDTAERIAAYARKISEEFYRSASGGYYESVGAEAVANGIEAGAWKEKP